jgi:hypothetical protein
VSFDDLLIHELVIYRMAAATSGGAETAGGANTTLTADTTAGATSVHVASAAAIAAGNWLRVGDTGEREARQVAVGGVAALVVTLTAPLALAHDSGDQVREVDDAGDVTLDEYGQAVLAPVVLATVDGRIRPITSREVPLTSEAGAAISTHIADIYPVTSLTTACWIESGGVRYDIHGIRDAAGAGHHLTLNLVAVS